MAERAETVTISEVLETWHGRQVASYLVVADTGFRNVHNALQQAIASAEWSLDTDRPHVEVLHQGSEGELRLRLTRQAS